MKFGLDALKNYLSTTTDNVIVLADKHTLEHCYFKLGVRLPNFIVPYGEGYKNINSCEYIWKHLAELKATRNTVLLCLGGGVLCDMGAFAATLYQRGMRFILCPTSLLAMVDASVGGKNGVNFLGFKNYIGTFNRPEEIFICENFLETLPEKEKINGYIEMLKHGLIADREHYDKVKMFLLSSVKEIKQDLIAKSIAIKQQHVEQDFKDLGIRKRLNFGHTIGHAIESWSLAISEENQELSHGVAVALGIICECHISKTILGLSDNDFNEIVIVLQGIVKGLNHPLPQFKDLRPYLLRDKKNDGEGINFSLLPEIGKCTENHLVDEDVILEAVYYLHRI